MPSVRDAAFFIFVFVVVVVVVVVVEVGSGAVAQGLMSPASLHLDLPLLGLAVRPARSGSGWPSVEGYRNRNTGWVDDGSTDAAYLALACVQHQHQQRRRWRQLIFTRTSTSFYSLPFLLLTTCTSVLSDPSAPPPRRPVTPPSLPSLFHVCIDRARAQIMSSISSSERYHYSFKALSHVPYRLFRPPTPTVGAVRSFRLTPCFQVTLEDVINAKHLPPLGRKEFEEYLLYKEYTIENL